MTTSYTTTIPDPAEVVALRLLAAVFDVTVSISDQIPRVACDVCGLEGAETAARVHGDPAEDSTAPTCTDCCVTCIPHVVRAAHWELRDGSRRGVRLEVASWAA